MRFTVERSSFDQNSYVNNTRILTDISIIFTLFPVTLQLIYFDITKTVFVLVSNSTLKF